MLTTQKLLALKKGDFDRLSLNYENLYPEYNTLNNWKPVKKKLFNKPLKLTFLKDVQDAYYNQLFYEPNVGYNFYDGVIVGVNFHNKPIIKRNLEFRIAPSYGNQKQ